MMVSVARDSCFNIFQATLAMKVTGYVKDTVQK